METPNEPKNDEWWSVRDTDSGQFMRADGSFTALPQDAQFSEPTEAVLALSTAAPVFSTATLEVVRVVMRTVCGTGPFPFVYPA